MNKKNTIRLTESDLKRVISESVKTILSQLYPPKDRLYEAFNMHENMVKFHLDSPMNGRLSIMVPFDEFVKAKFKNDYLWEKAAQQHDVQLMRNGYFEVDPKDPHAAEVNRIF